MTDREASVARPLLAVRDLTVSFGHGHARSEVVRGVSFDVPAGSTVGVVGESGSGKSVTSLALTRLFPKSSEVTVGGQISFQGQNLATLPAQQLRKIRGAGISYVFQDPLSSLNPVRRCGEQVAEAIRIHEPHVDGRKVAERVALLFERLGLPRAREVARQYPHELSGGMRQRVMIAMALACRPALLVADEPTTALDVVVQKQIVTLLREVVEEFGTSILFISHDLALVSSIADHVVVMHDGEIVEQGPTAEVSMRPREAYTRKLWRATPTLDGPVRPSLETRAHGNRSLGNLLEVESVSHSFSSSRRGHTGPLALDDVSITARAGETVCVVGESGSGKSTLARTVVGLISPDHGQIVFNGQQLLGGSRKAWRGVRQDIQMVFQDPYASLNPRMRVADLVAEGLLIGKRIRSKSEARNRSIELLEMVGLQARHADRYPHQFSGGQRQRIAIARALALRPKLLVCDEPVTSLDVSVRAQIVKLLIDLQDQEGLTYLFITHDIALARQIGDRAVVMHRGKVVESGATATVIDHPTDDYTRALRAAVPDLPTPGPEHPADALAR
ncbi:ABC transporter ATP-binding protein [Agromyces aerolatus]|uniref:ABC transporter ATP-binding protein n=1 Tax=Agromyces sp. LY-1074 TaxID=3074080 RepID=UPI002856001E|nr:MULTISPECIES: ABC transporter ATP-binding protein [unclassified Agromyces]MDR5701852.1 ABC transporter ATP-binding protein [Agromyces sp. LY-1074]MDR5708075.1 ABC transporter ATP-binding protein [Agromyces sp. LY-1358]